MWISPLCPSFSSFFQLTLSIRVPNIIDNQRWWSQTESLVVAISKSMIIFLSNLLLIFSEVGELKFGLLDKTLPSARRSTLWERKVRLIVTFYRIIRCRVLHDKKKRHCAWWYCTTCPSFFRTVCRTVVHLWEALFFLDSSVSKSASLSKSCVSSSDPDRIPESLIDGNDSRDEDHDNHDQDL